jgi:arabinogalactan oligomer/maltooligosaccharide transport system permease protein
MSNRSSFESTFFRPALAWWFLAPSVLVMTLIVGVPLVLTIIASATDLNQQNFQFDKAAVARELQTQEQSLLLLQLLQQQQETKIQGLRDNNPAQAQKAEQELVALLADTASNPLPITWRVFPLTASGQTLVDLLIASGSIVADQATNLAAAQSALETANRVQRGARQTVARLKAKLNQGGRHWVGLQNYRDILGGADSDFPRVLGQTVFWTFTNVFFHFTLGLLLALLLNKQFRGNAIYRLLIMVPWAIPSFVAAFSWRFMFNFPDGFINGMLKFVGLAPLNFLGDSSLMLPTCVLINIWAGVPFMMITLLGGLQNIGDDMYEAADIEGASAWQQFRHITLPLLRPVATIAVLLGVVWTFNMFNIIYLVTLGSEAVEKDIFVTYTYKAFKTYGNYGTAASYAVLILSLLLCFAATYFRIIESDESTGKGAGKGAAKA